MTYENDIAAIEAILRKEIAQGNKLAALGFFFLIAAKIRSEGHIQAEAEAVWAKDR